MHLPKNQGPTITNDLFDFIIYLVPVLNYSSFKLKYPPIMLCEKIDFSYILISSILNLLVTTKYNLIIKFI